MLGGVGDPEKPRQVLPGLRIAARTFQITETSALATECRQLTWGDFAFKSEKPVTIDLPADTSETEVAGTFRLEGLDDALRAVERPTSKPQVEQTEPDCPVAGVVWSVGPEGGNRSTGPNPAPRPSTSPSPRATSTATETTKSSPAPTTSTSTASRRTDNCAWKVAAAGRITTTTIADLDGSPQKCVAAGSEDCSVYALTPSGETKWSFELPHYKRRARACPVGRRPRRRRPRRACRRRATTGGTMPWITGVTSCGTTRASTRRARQPPPIWTATAVWRSFAAPSTTGGTVPAPTAPHGGAIRSAAARHGGAVGQFRRWHGAGGRLRL